MTAKVFVRAANGGLVFEIDGVLANADSGLRLLGQSFTETPATIHRLEAELLVALAARDAAALQHSRALQFPLSALLPGRASRLRPRLDAAETALQTLAGERNACAVQLRFDLGEAALDAFARLAAAHHGLTRSARVWEVPHRQLTETMPAAPPRVAVAAKATLPDFVASNLPGLAFVDRDGAGLTLFPGFITERKPGPDGGTALANILAAKVKAGVVRFPERDVVPHDASVVDHTWERVNRDGSPDRRYANNTRIPIVAYGLVQIEMSVSDQRAFLVSSQAAAAGFALAFDTFQSSLRSRPAEDTTGRHGRDTWPVAGPAPVVRVPPPPRASAAHELTAAVAVVIALAGWSISVPQAGPPQIRGPAALVASVPEQSAPVLPSPGTARNEPRPEPDPSAAMLAPISTGTGSPAASPAAPERRAAERREQVVTRTGSNVRSGPNGTAEVVRTVPAGYRMSVFARSPGNWVQIGETSPWGWIHASLLEAAE